MVIGLCRCPCDGGIALGRAIPIVIVVIDGGRVACVSIALIHDIVALHDAALPDHVVIGIEELPAVQRHFDVVDVRSRIGERIGDDVLHPVAAYRLVIDIDAAPAVARVVAVACMAVIAESLRLRIEGEDDLVRIVGLFELDRLPGIFVFRFGFGLFGEIDGRQFAVSHFVARARRLDGHPAVPVVVDFRPGVRVIVGHFHDFARCGTARIPNGVARGNAQRAQNERRCGGKVLADALLVVAEEGDDDILFIVERAAVILVVFRGVMHIARHIFDDVGIVGVKSLLPDDGLQILLRRTRHGEVVVVDETAVLPFRRRPLAPERAVWPAIHLVEIIVEGALIRHGVVSPVEGVVGLPYITAPEHRMIRVGIGRDVHRHLGIVGARPHRRERGGHAVLQPVAVQRDAVDARFAPAAARVIAVAPLLEIAVDGGIRTDGEDELPRGVRLSKGYLFRRLLLGPLEGKLKGRHVPRAVIGIGRIDVHPAEAVEIDLRPGVGVVVGHLHDIARLGEAHIAHGVARGDAEGAQEQRRRRGEVQGIARFVFAQKGDGDVGLTVERGVIGEIVVRGIVDIRRDAGDDVGIVRPETHLVDDALKIGLCLCGNVGVVVVDVVAVLLLRVRPVLRQASLGQPRELIVIVVELGGIGRGGVALVEDIALLHDFAAPEYVMVGIGERLAVQAHVQPVGAAVRRREDVGRGILHPVAVDRLGIALGIRPALPRIVAEAALAEVDIIGRFGIDGEYGSPLKVRKIKPGRVPEQAADAELAADGDVDADVDIGVIGRVGKEHQDPEDGH